MWKLLIIAIAGFVLYKMFMGDKSKKESDKKKETAKKVAKGEMVKDPVCGAFVSLDSAVRVRDGEKVHHFCSYECRDAFIQRLEASKGGDTKDIEQ